VTQGGSWRKHSTHSQETRAVKRALATVGIPAKVSHGKGTAWAWLEINLGLGARENRELQAGVLAIAKDITGRTGDYNGEILILAQ